MATPKQPIYNLFKDGNGWDFCLIKKGRYIGGSRQGYAKRITAINAIRSMNPLAKFQDDTTLKIYTFNVDTGKVVLCDLKPIKPYLP